MGKGRRGDGRDQARGWAGPPHHLPTVVWQRCARCGREERTSGMVRRRGADGRRVSLCYECYERATDGAWHGTDEYWDGGNWVPLSEGA